MQIIKKHKKLPDPHCCSFNRMDEEIDIVQIFQSDPSHPTKEIVFYCRDGLSATLLERALEGVEGFDYFTNYVITGKKDADTD